MFISCSFDPFSKTIADWVQATFKENGIDVHISGQVEAKPLPESVKEKIRASEAMVTIITDRFSAWVQNEIGIAYDAGKPVYALVQEGAVVEGIIPHITLYKRFNPLDHQTLMQTILEIVTEILKNRKEAATLAILGFGLLVLLILGLGGSGK